MMHSCGLVAGIAAFGSFLCAASALSATDTTVAYQGELKQLGVPDNGPHNFAFSLWSALAGGTQIGSTVTLNSVQVTDGLFTVQLDFGANAFDNSERWLQIGVDGTPLTPRQPITRTPYAIQTRGIFVNDVGNVGIGTNTPTDGKVVVQSAPNGFGFVQTDGSCIVGTRANSLGGWVGTQSNHDLILFQGGNAGIILNQSGFSVLNHTHFANRVGIGTTAPNVPEASLQIIGGPSWTTSTWTKAISTANGGAIEMNAGTNRFGIGASNGFPLGSTLAFFSTTDGSSSAVPTYLMALTAGGNLGLGINSPSFQLQLSLNSAGKPTSNTWTISSDARLKKNINTIEHALDDLLALRGVTYQWRNPASQGNMAGTYTGMIAQDVEKVFPEWIGEDANGYKTLTVIGFEGLTVEALRDLRAEKDVEIALLQQQIDDLKALVAQLVAEKRSGNIER